MNLKLQRSLIAVACCAAWAIVAAPAMAVFISQEASNNATVQPSPTGPRPGGNGKAFFNMEGSANGSFASFGVADFAFTPLPPLGFPVTHVSDATLKMTQSNAGFTTDGPISIYYTANTSQSIEPGEMIFYQGSDGAASVDPVFSPLTLLGSGNFVEVATGTEDSYSL